ncbi:hypothetical protein [Nocardia sp. NPDC049526]|uniref:hypothetical protein n=1 Tax=Nocardia sp. NPDC049526 TaxID=3364316 RepID=UPI0037AC3CD8
MIRSVIRRLVLGVALGTSVVTGVVVPASAAARYFSDVEARLDGVRCVLDDQEVVCIVGGATPVVPGPRPTCPTDYGPYPILRLGNSGPAEASYTCRIIIAFGEPLPFHKIISTDAITCSGLPTEPGIQCVNSEHGFTVSRTEYTLR